MKGPIIFRVNFTRYFYIESTSQSVRDIMEDWFGPNAPPVHAWRDASVIGGADVIDTVEQISIEEYKADRAQMADKRGDG